MKFFSPKGWGGVLAAIGLALTVQPANAAFISGSGTWGSFEGTLIVTSGGAGSDSATLEICLTNTSPDANGGFLTAFAFNNPGDAFAISLSSSDSTTFDTFLTGVDADPYGTFDYGVGVGGDFLGGGSPNDGLGVNDPELCWVFSVTGADADELTDQDFLSAFNTGANNEEFQNKFFIARFRGFENDESDKVPADGGGGGNVVPAPAGLLLLASAVPVLTLRRLLRRRAAA